MFSCTSKTILIMKSKKLYTKLLLVGSMLLTSGGLSSCEDFLTILPTDQLPEENFWQEKGDLENVRAGAYQKLAAGGLSARLLPVRRDDGVLYSGKPHRHLGGRGGLRTALLHGTDHADAESLGRKRSGARLPVRHPGKQSGRLPDPCLPDLAQAPGAHS